MASIRKTANGYRAQVFVKGVRDSCSFRTHREASAWASARETEIRANADKPPGELHTLADALEKYRDEVSPLKRGSRWETLRIDAFLRSPILPTQSPIGSITPEILGEWSRDRRKTVKDGTILREIAVLSAVLEEARKVWKWITVNPASDMRKPAEPDHRDVVLTRAQIKAMLRGFGYSPRRPICSITQACAVAFLLALRTGMRAGELCRLEWSRVHDGYCVLPVTKTKPRDVPLTAKAMRIIGKMRGFDPLRVFGVEPKTLDVLFRRTRDRAGLSGFTFHDSRHTAATWLAQRIHVLDLCKMFGWKTTKQAMGYYNPKASDIAHRINSRSIGQGIDRLN